MGRVGGEQFHWEVFLPSEGQRTRELGQVGLSFQDIDAKNIRKLKNHSSSHVIQYLSLRG